MDLLLLIHFFQRTVILFPLCFLVISINCYSAASPGEDTTIIRPLKKVDLGYLSIPEEYYPGTASSLSRKSIQPYHKLNFTGALAGQIPGLYVLNRSDEPGQEKYDMLVHGISSLYKIPPLIIIDGIPGRDLSSLNENDIESITVLKDAATVLYGTKASNGMILVTTRKGIKGKPAVSISFNQGIEVPTVLPEMADAPTYANMLNEAREYHGELPIYTENEIRKFADGSDPWRYPNTNWVKKVCKSYVLNNSFNTSLSGGSNTMKYYASAGLKNQDGLFRGNLSNAHLKYFRVNTEAKISIVRTGLNLYYSQLTGNQPIYQSIQIFEDLTKVSPLLVASWPGGKPNDEFEYNNNLTVTTTPAAGKGKRKKADTELIWYAIADIPQIKGLSLNFRFAYDEVKDSTVYQERQYELYSWTGEINPQTGEPELISRLAGQATGQYNYNREETVKKLYNAFINFDREINTDNSIRMMLGYEREDKEYESGFREYGINNFLNYNLSEKRYFGLLHYGYRSKYLLNIIFGRDFSIHLPPKNSDLMSRSFAAAWLISKEPFWKELFPQNNSLKLNMSWTKSGSDYYLESSNGVSGVPNPNLNWENVSIYMLGMEASFIQGKLDLKANYYRHKHSDVLFNINMFNDPRILVNSGKVINKVFEGYIGFKDHINEFIFDLSFNGSFSRNNVTDLDENSNGIPDYQRINGHSATGEEAFEGLYYQAGGIFKDDTQVSSLPHFFGARPGDIIFKDVNKDGKIDGLDKVRVKNSVIPKFNGGLRCNFQYRQFDLAFLFNGVAGTSYYYQPFSGLKANYYKLYAESRWTKENQSSSYPRSGYGYNEYWSVNPSTFWLKDGGFIRLKHIEAGYTFRQKLSLIKGNIRVYISASNLFKIDGTHLVDPEAGGNYYPIMRTFNLGIRFDLGRTE